MTRRALHASAVGFFALALVLHPRDAAADDGPFAAAHARSQAKKHAERAAADYKAGQFLPALEGFTKAYDLSPVPEVLFNIGQCHFQLSSWERAVFFYRAYLHDRPNAPNRALVEELIAEAERERKTREAARSIPLPVASAQREAARASAAEDPIYKRWWFWAAVGTAAAVAGGTIHYMSDGSSSALPARSLGTIDSR